MIKEEDLNVIGITKEEWETINLFKLTSKYAQAKAKIAKLRVPDDVKEKNTMTLNIVYDELKQLLRDAKTGTATSEVVEDNKEVNFDMMLPTVKLPQPLAGITNIKTNNLPTPKKYMNKGVVINPEPLDLKLNLTEIIVPADKKNGDILVYTDLTNIALLTIRER